MSGRFYIYSVVVWRGSVVRNQLVSPMESSDRLEVTKNEYLDRV